MGKVKDTIGYWITFFIGVTFAYLMWMVWKKLTELIGDTWVVMGICTAIVVFGIITGYFSFQKIAEKFV